MADVHQLPLRQIDQGDLYAVSEELTVIQTQLALLPMLAMLTGADLVLAAIELLFRKGQPRPVAISSLSRPRGNAVQRFASDPTKERDAKAGKRGARFGVVTTKESGAAATSNSKEIPS